MSTIMTREERTRSLRYKRPALASLGYAALREELYTIMSECEEISWWVDEDEDETLLNALDGDSDDVSEFRIAFSDLESEADELNEAIQEWHSWDEEEFGKTYDDCTVGLIGNCFKTVDFFSGDVSEDYTELTAPQAELAKTEAGKRLMRLTKAQMLDNIGQCLRVLLAFLNVRQKYDYLKATFDILRDQNSAILRIVREIDEAYRAADEVGWFSWRDEVKKFDRLLDELPERVWVE